MWLSGIIVLCIKWQGPTCEKGVVNIWSGCSVSTYTGNLAICFPKYCLFSEGLLIVGWLLMHMNCKFYTKLGCSYTNYK